ncbi:MAG: MBL fold metallo-hydrolase [Anaerolineales bacterium]|nr:MBL fold metallo-hydrolase [Anaerolineales bacterium]
MRLTFLGTGAGEGYPDIFCECERCREARTLGGRNLRLRSSLLVNDDLLLDFGPDLLASAHRCGVSLSTIRTILVTHGHSDHFHLVNLVFRKPGMTSVRPLRLKLFAPSDAIQAIQNAFLNLDDVLTDTQIIAPFENWEHRGYRFASYQAFHGEGRIEALFYSVDDGQHRCLYATDTGPFPEATWQALAGQTFDAIILEETMGPGEYPQHMNWQTFLAHHRRFKDAGMLRPGGRVYATHIGHNWNPPHDKVVEVLEPHGVIVAYDGLVIEL